MDEKALASFREGKDKNWKEDKESPLTDKQKRTFKGLKYFPPNKDLSFELSLDTNIPEVGKEVVIKTTGGDEQVYKRAGKINFQVEGEEVETIVFEDPEVEQFQYYLIFKDSTTGKETYENGRMMQVEKKGDKLVVDFNYAYNPYSSYNDNWDCPITPEENTLNVPIKAGEKKFND
ncbi:MAG TPA: DUF1684 domain-containing protein [bacterium]|nr:DUF1684 domain-containing protein [bacterium]